MSNSPAAARKVATKTHNELVREWNAVASLRAEHILSGRDLTHNLILVPTILELADPMKSDVILDVGCGIGDVAALLAEKAALVYGIDPSHTSITMGRKLFRQIDALEFVEATVEDFAARRHRDVEARIVVSNMTLMATSNLSAVLSAIRSVMTLGGRFVFSIPHPCFWPWYAGYGDADWFSYSSEIAVEWPYKISTDDREGSLVTHFHRPLSTYMGSLEAHSFKVAGVREPIPDADLSAGYPRPWTTPHVLVVQCLAD